MTEEVNMRSGKRTLQCYVDESTIKKLSEIAVADRRSMSSTMRELILAEYARRSAQPQPRPNLIGE
jgi:predicted transcriptional regulator